MLHEHPEPDQLRDCGPTHLELALLYLPDVAITLEHDGNELVYGFYGYRNDYYAVEFNASGTVSGYIKAEHLAVLAAAFDQAAND